MQKTCLCAVCGKPVVRYESQFRQRKTVLCSRECFKVWQKPGRPRKALLRGVCKNCGKAFQRKIGNHKMLFCSQSCAAGRKGAAHPSWKGGRARHGVRAVRKRVREVGECERCGSVGHLHGHHLKPYSTHPELGADISNILVLCANCHADEHPEIQNVIAIPRVKSGKEIVCIVCGKLRYVEPYRFATAKFCSHTCRHEWIRRSSPRGSGYPRAFWTFSLRRKASGKRVD
jgi:hypothetical protein